MGREAFESKLILEVLRTHIVEGGGVRLGEIKADSISNSTKNRIAREVCEEGYLSRKGKKYYPGKESKQWLNAMEKWYYNFHYSLMNFKE